MYVKNIFLMWQKIGTKTLWKIFHANSIMNTSENTEVGEAINSFV